MQILYDFSSLPTAEYLKTGKFCRYLQIQTDLSNCCVFVLEIISTFN